MRRGSSRGFTEPVRHTADAARQKQRERRLDATAGYYQGVRKELDTAGVSVYTYYVNPRRQLYRRRIRCGLRGRESSRCGRLRRFVRPGGVAPARARFPGVTGMFVGLHNHDNLSDPDAYASEAQHGDRAVAVSEFQDDPRHRGTSRAANGDCAGFLERHHDRVAGLHVGDRRRNNGRSTPFGEGDAA